MQTQPQPQPQPDHNIDTFIETLNQAREKYEDKASSGKAYAKAKVWLTSLSARVVYYGNILDVLVQHHSEYVSLAWGTFKFLFVVSINSFIDANDRCSHVQIGAAKPRRTHQQNLETCVSDCRSSSTAKDGLSSVPDERNARSSCPSIRLRLEILPASYPILQGRPPQALCQGHLSTLVASFPGPVRCALDTGRKGQRTRSSGR